MTNQDDIIIHMARLYGTPVQEQNAEVEYRFTIEQLGLLISTVTILERGACAKVCDDVTWEGPFKDAAIIMSKRIRSRGET